MNYVTELRNEIEAIRKETRAGKLPREDRLKRIQLASDKYALAHAEQYERERLLLQEECRDFPYRPHDARLLEQLTNLALHEELTDKSQYKTRDAEYPFLSDMQMARRTEGAHERNTGVQKGEAPYQAASTIGMDGRNYATPIRRKRSDYENLLRDEKMASRNKERRRKYREFTQIQPVITYKMTDFTKETPPFVSY